MRAISSAALCDLQWVKLQVANLEFGGSILWLDDCKAFAESEPSPVEVRVRVRG